MGFQVIEVSSKSPAPNLVELGELCTIFNSDMVTTIYLGDSHNFLRSDFNAVPMIPGQALTFDGKARVHGIAPTGQTVAVIKYPGAVQINTAAQTPSATPPFVVSRTATNGQLIDLVGTVLNPGGLAIQLGSISISSFVAGTPASGFNAQDIVIDNVGNQYLAQQVGLPAAGGICAVSVTQDMKTAIVPAGAKLQLSNGMATGVLHQCAASVTYYLVRQ